MEMEKYNWINDLVKAEEQIEEKGIFDLHAGNDPQHILSQETLRFLQDLKNSFVDASSTFNELKTSPLGRIKIYGIAKTVADFMLFRNGYKMIFSIKEPGKILIRFNFVGAQLSPSALPTLSSQTQPLMEEHMIVGKMGILGDVKWTFQSEPVLIDHIVRFHMSLFVKESTR